MSQFKHLEEAGDGSGERPGDGEEGHEAAGVDGLLDLRLHVRAVPHVGQPERAEPHPVHAAVVVLRVHGARRGGRVGVRRPSCPHAAWSRPRPRPPRPAAASRTNQNLGRRRHS